MHVRIVLPLILILTLSLAACNNPASPPAPTPAAQIDLGQVKAYATDQVTQMKTATSALEQIAQNYYTLLEAEKFNYQQAWQQHAPELTTLMAEAKTQWMAASVHYELNEGIVAGVPSLAHFDVWLDAGPSGAEAPTEALDWQLKLPNGQVLDKPGNLFHHLTEPAIWGTHAEFVGLAVDLDQDGTLETGEILPEANLFLASSQALAKATVELDTAIVAWQPTLEDAMTALVTMLPTMNEYFEQWKLSTFVSGQNSTQESFVALSRLLDITGILNGLNVTYDNISPVIQAKNPELHQQIDGDLNKLVAYVNDLYQQEKEGKRFTPEDADLFGTKAQNEATMLVGQVAQAAALLNVTIEE